MIDSYSNEDIYKKLLELELSIEIMNKSFNERLNLLLGTFKVYKDNEQE